MVNDVLFAFFTGYILIL